MLDFYMANIKQKELTVSLKKGKYALLHDVAGNIFM